MQLLNHNQRPCETFSFGFAIIILVSFLFENTFAEYDCSAKEDGWYYDPEFCHIYWRCIHGTSEEFECASGTAWDHHENRCNWLDSVDCSRAEKTTAKSMSDYDDEQEIVDEDSNNNNEEDDEQPIVVVKKTKKKKKKHRKIESNKRKLDGDNNEEIDGKDREILFSSSYGKLFLLIISQTSSSNDFLCAGRDGFFADPEYCTRYYRCSHGIDEVFECPRGTAWDEITKSCAWVDQVNCDQKILGYSTNTTTSSRKKSDTESVLSDSNVALAVSSTNGKDNSGSSSTAVECQPTGIYSIPDPSECNAYYQCEKGTRTRLNCPERKLFDIEKRECNEYERVFCGTRAANLADKNQCINKRDGIHPDTERDCHFYYQCVSQNKMREAKCPSDQKFSSYTGRCGPASNAPMPCGSFVPGSAAIKNHQNIGTILNFLPNLTESHLPLNIIRQTYESTKSIDNISRYQSTFPTSLKNVTTTLHSTIIFQTLITKPNSYLYNPDEDDDNDDNVLNRIKRDKIPFVCKADGYFPDRENCRIYHICTSGVDTAAVCGEGTSWDPVKKNCNWENTVQCKKGLRKWDQITDIRGVTLFATDAALAWRAKKKSTTTNQPIKVDSNFTCEYDAEGFFPDPKYCHIYHYCGIGAHTVLKCADNLWFSTESQGCEWPDKSDCKAGHLYTSSTAATNMIDGDGNAVTTPRHSRPTNVYLPIECPKGLQEYFSDPYDCSAFHYCNGGIDKPSYCDAGLFWDKKLGCQWPKDVPHCQHKCPPNGQRLRFVSTHSCCHYYECINGHLKEQVCPLHKLYSVETKSCENFQVVPCGSRKKCIDPCDYDNSPLCEFKPVCRDKPNGNYVDQYRPNCQFHYTCLESRTFNYTACEHGYRFSVQHQKCLPAKQVKCLGINYNDPLLFKIVFFCLFIFKFYI
ncbi:unnamed protein product [Rotaria sordida]|uniref:Chitin-binding type-2 domain-containing protein n=1 Tax=Rotaria sordida TaxID=392033 RepID=A0A814ZGP7_9BILA|nr:unnamed protein product [Rotaria sordida]